MHKVFTDWLDVTYAPDDVPEPELRVLLLGCGFDLVREFGGTASYLAKPRGMVKVTYATRFARISISGGALTALRDAGLLDELLWILATSPHKVTRLDAALDVQTDASVVIERLGKRYPTGAVSLGRKALPVLTMLETRPDGEQSGTYYVGHRTAARMTARVYDKSFEALKNRGEVYPLPVTRYEVTARKDSGATLRDAAEPAAIFWHIASPALIPSKPKGIPMWQPHGDFTGWEHTPRTYTAHEVLERRISHSAELEAFIALADSLGAYGRSSLMHLLEKRILPSDVSEVS